MNFSLEQNVDILSAYHVERFTYLRDNEQYQDADAIAQEYICNGEVEDDMIEEITAASGWCIKSIDYDIQLK